MKISISASKRFLKLDQNTNVSVPTIRGELGGLKLLLKEVKAIADEIADNITKNISSGKKYTGGAVARLAKSTIKRKGSSIPLIHTGKLLHGIIVSRAGDGYIIQFRKTRYKGGISLDKVATYLNYGTPKMPSRPFFGITPANARRIIVRVLSQRFKKTKA